MDFLQTATAIQAAIERHPGDGEAYRDLFSLCRSWGEADEQAAHGFNRGLRLLCSRNISHVDARTAAILYEVWRKSLLYDAPVDFDSYMLYVELDRKPEKRFYQPRRHYLRPMVQGFQDILDGKLRLLTISMPKRAGKSQTGINFVNMLSGKYPDRSTLMEGTGDDLVTTPATRMACPSDSATRIGQS